jgi:hypothetical protein
MAVRDNLHLAKIVAVQKAKRENKNFNVVLMRPNHLGKFCIGTNSAYEIVEDSFLFTEREDVKLLHTTNDLIKNEQSKK